MASVKEAVIKDRQHQKLKNEVREQTFRVEMITNGIADATKKLANYESTVDDLTHDLALPFRTEYLSGVISDRLHNVERTRNRIKQELTDSQAKIYEVKDKLLRAELAYKASTPTNIDIKRTNLKTLVENDPRISRLQLHACEYDLETFDYVKFLMKDVVATINNFSPSVTAGYAPTTKSYVKLPYLSATLYEDTAKFKPVNGHGWDLYVRNSCHPHITNSRLGTPCWGDFGAPYIEAMEAGDISAAIAVATLFLENIDHEDSAGSYGQRLIPRTRIYDDLNRVSKYSFSWGVTLTYPDGTHAPLYLCGIDSECQLDWIDDFNSKGTGHHHIKKICEELQNDPTKTLPPNNIIELGHAPWQPHLNRQEYREYQSNILNELEAETA